MRLRPLFVLLACVLLFWSAAAVSCGGGGGSPSSTGGPPLTLQEYFQKVQALNSHASQRFATVQGKLLPNLSDDQKVKVLRDAIPTEAGFLRELRNGLQQLSPPPEVKDAHQEAIAALNAFLEYAQKASGTAATATDLAIVGDFLNSQEARDATKRLHDSCAGLQRAAADHGITVDLGCTSAAAE